MQRLGRTAEDVELPSDVADVAALRAWLGARHAPLANPQVQVTVSRQFAGPKTPVKDGNEIAFIDP